MSTRPSLPWKLPVPALLQPYDPKLHLERTIAILNLCMSMARYSAPGMRSAAKNAAKELAIQLNEWVHFPLLESDIALASATKDLFTRAGVRVPADWCSRVRGLGLLPSQESRLS